MAQLMQMRRRIKTIETIKKVTNAMRLIAMSGIQSLKAKKLPSMAIRKPSNSSSIRLKR